MINQRGDMSEVCGGDDERIACLCSLTVSPVEPTQVVVAGLFVGEPEGAAGDFLGVPIGDEVAWYEGGQDTGALLSGDDGLLEETKRGVLVVFSKGDEALDGEDVGVSAGSGEEPEAGADVAEGWLETGVEEVAYLGEEEHHGDGGGVVA